MKLLITTVLTATLFAAACSNDPTTPDTRARVRFVNAATGMTGSGGFTTNEKFATGSSLAVGKASSSCSRLEAGSTSFGFGTSNSGGSGLSGTALATLSNQSVTDGGNYTLAATGSASSPLLFLLDNTFPGTLTGNQAAVRFVNLAPGTDTTANTYVVYNGAIGTGTQLGVNIAVGAPTTFSVVSSGSNQFSVLKLPGHVTAVEGSAGVLNLKAGTVNTVAIVSNSSGGFQLVNIPNC